MINRRRSLGNKFIPKPYLKFTALEDGTFKHNTDDLEYSLNDGKTWTALPANTDTPIIHTGESICWRGTMNPGHKNQWFSSTGKFDASGNPLSLKYKNNFVNATVVHYQYYQLFYGCTNIINAKDLSIADDFGNAINVCMKMFEGCTSLLTAPELPATNLRGNGCYSNMFYGCSSLISAPALPATTLAPSCYSNMFYGCTSLTSTPVMSPTTLASQCCQGMFANCGNLQNVLLTLPATTLVDRCYYRMFDNTKIASIPTLPSVANNTTNSYGSMFRSCTQLTTVQLPEFMNVLPENMFNGCSNLESIYIPSTITDSSNGAFNNCTKLKTVNISNLNNYLNITHTNAAACPTCNGADLYLNGVKVTDVTLSQAKDYVLYNCKSIETVNWSGTITSIGNAAFHGCSNLSNVTIPNTVTSIGSSSFRSTKITSINIPYGITTLEDYTFCECSLLESVTIPSTLTSIGNQCFKNIKSPGIIYITDLDAWCRISFSIFRDYNPQTKLKHLYLNGTEVTSVVVPNDITSLVSTFSGLSSITSITLPEGLETIGQSAFYETTGISHLDIPSTVTSILSSGLEFCYATELILPAGLTTIASYSFANMKQLTKMICYATVPPSVDSANSFINTNNCPIYVPDASVNDYKAAAGWSSVASRIYGISELPE